MSSSRAVFKERIIKQVLTVFAFSSLLFLFLIFAFILVEGLPLFYKVGVKNIIFGMKWAPTKGFFGIFPMIVSSFLVTFGALIIGGPLGLGCAVYLAEYAGKRQKLFLKPALELLAGIPSVVYGFLGVLYIVPFIRYFFGGSGFSLLATSIVLGIMILPTVISISYDALMSVPRSYREGALAMGSTKVAVDLARCHPGRQIRHSGKLHSGHGPGHWRDHGGYHGCRQCAENTRQRAGPPAHPHQQHCA